MMEGGCCDRMIFSVLLYLLLAKPHAVLKRKDAISGFCVSHDGVEAVISSGGKKLPFMAHLIQ